MSPEGYAVLIAVIIVLTALGFVIFKKMPRRLKNEYFLGRWKHIQQRCPDSTQWTQAIQEADDLLDEALKRKRFKGKNPGERLVEAQKLFTNNEAVWFGHKLRTRLDTNPEFPLTKDDVQRALVGLRQALKDIGALK